MYLSSLHTSKSKPRIFLKHHFEHPKTVRGSKIRLQLLCTAKIVLNKSKNGTGSPRGKHLDMLSGDVFYSLLFLFLLSLIILHSVAQRTKFI